MKSAAHDTRYGKNPFACKRLHGFSANGAAPRGGWVGFGGLGGLGGSRNARLGWLAWPGGWAAQGTLQVRPCKLVGAIHGACAPAQPTRPASDTFRRLARHGKKKEEQGQEQKQDSGQPSDWTSPLPHFDLTDLIHAWRGSTVSTKVDTYEEPPVPTAAGKCRGWAGVGWQDRWRHGWRHRAPMDGFTACPANPHRPAQPAETQSRFGFCSGSGSGFGLCRCRAQPCRTPPLRSPGTARRYP